MKNDSEKQESTSLFEGLFQNIFNLISKIPQIFQNNKKLFGYVFLASWITLLVLTGFQIMRWFFGMKLNLENLVFYILVFLVLVLVPMLISMFNEWEKRNNQLQDRLKKILEEKEKVS